MASPSANIQSTSNFMVPAQGATAALNAVLPGAGNFGPPSGAGFYGIDFRSVNQIIQGQAFIPQAVTVDCTNLSSGTYATVSIPAISVNWQVYAGETRTFQIPALPDLQVTIVPSSATPVINTVWYNYPALPDSQGTGTTNIAGSVAVSALPPVAISALPSDDGTDYSANPLTLPAHLLTTIPALSTRIGYVVQNQSTDVLAVVFSATGVSGPYTMILLAAAAGAGQPGGSIDGSGLPHAGQIDIYGPSAVDNVAVREW